MDKGCSTYAIVVKGLLYDIKSKLEEYKSMKKTNDPSKVNGVINRIYKGYVFQNGMNPATPPGCGNSILDFINKLIIANPNWNDVHGWTDTKIYNDSLNDADIVEIITAVQEGIDNSKKGGRRSFKKRTTSAKRKSIKRSRSSCRRHRRTARK